MRFIDDIKKRIQQKSSSKDNPSKKPTKNQAKKENPYLNARRAWNEHTAKEVFNRQIWQFIAILSLLIVLIAIAGIIRIGSQSKFIPYVVEVDKLGQTATGHILNPSAPVDSRIIHASVAEFIEDARKVTPDVAIQRKSIFRLYAKLSPSDPATTKMNEWLNGDEASNPFKRAAREMVSIQIKSVLPQSPDTWQVDWVETIRDRQGNVKDEPVDRRALVTVYHARPTSETTEEQIRMNPMGVFIRDFSWSKLS